MRRTALALIPLAAAIMSAVQCVVSPGASVRVSVTTRSATSGARRAIREGRVLSRSRHYIGIKLLPSMMSVRL